ncbi:MAG TPA: sigma-70 family RNA polymerase sigma factor [Thermomicrobiales bacterium]|nr:sigma-70 family RNA polymerase sigma factor [Thermomicrobiales bacterium]
MLIGERDPPRARAVDAPGGLPASDCDVDLVVAALADRRCFWLLYDRYLDRLYGYARSRLGSAADADDVVADTMLAAFEHLEHFDPARGAFSTWIFTIARRKVIDHGRYHRRLRRLAARQQALAAPVSEDDSYECVARNEQDEAVRRTVRRLPPADRDVVALRYSAELSTDEIARVLDVSPAAARQRLTRARQRLKQMLEADL